MDLGYCRLIAISASIAALGLVVLVASKAEFYLVRAAYWCALVGTTMLAVILIGGLVQHVLLQVRGH